MDGIGELVNLEHFDVQVINVLTSTCNVVVPCLTIPTEVGKLSKLSTMRICGHKVYGSIPTEIGRLSHLEVLTIYGTSLDGLIPTELSFLNLTFLNLQDNPTLRGSVNLPGAKVLLGGTPHVQCYQETVYF